MKKTAVILAALVTTVSAAAAQEANRDDILASYIRRSHAALTKNLAAVVETMPEGDFGFRPAGAIEEVRTFGEIVVHMLTATSFICAMGDGKPDSTAWGARGLSLDKARLIALVAETTTRCTSYFATLSDGALTQVITAGSGSRALQSTRGTAAIFAIVHANEHYGNLVTYLRAKGLVPPAAAAQASFLSPVASRMP